MFERISQIMADADSRFSSLVCEGKPSFLGVLLCRKIGSVTDYEDFAHVRRVNDLFLWLLDHKPSLKKSVPVTADNLRQFMILTSSCL